MCVSACRRQSTQRAQRGRINSMQLRVEPGRRVWWNVSPHTALISLSFKCVCVRVCVCIFSDILLCSSKFVNDSFYKFSTKETDRRNIYLNKASSLTRLNVFVCSVIIYKKTSWQNKHQEHSLLQCLYCCLTFTFRESLTFLSLFLLQIIRSSEFLTFLVNFYLSLTRFLSVWNLILVIKF